MVGILGSHGLHAVPAVVAGSVPVVSRSAASVWPWAAGGAAVANAAAAGAVARAAAASGVAAASSVAARRPRGLAGRPGSGEVGPAGWAGRLWLLVMVSPLGRWMTRNGLVAVGVRGGR